MDSSKTGINILIIVSILLIGSSLVATYIKGPKTESVATQTTPAAAVVPAENSVMKKVVTSTSTIPVPTYSPLLTQKSWTWTKTTASGTKDVTPKKAGAFTITLTATGTVSGTTDCNNFFGSFNAGTSTITFGPFGSTRMFCEGSQETDFTTLLSNSLSYAFGATNTLTILAGSSTLHFK